MIDEDNSSLNLISWRAVQKILKERWFFFLKLFFLSCLYFFAFISLEDFVFLFQDNKASLKQAPDHL